MGSDSYEPFGALNEIRDSVFLLSFGKAYLCEEPFLKKIGATMDARLTSLQQDILSPKKQFPGKFANEVETDGVLEELRETARRLQNPDQEINEFCTVGRLGEQLEASVRTLTEAIKKIRMQVEGASPAYNKADSFVGLLDRLSPAGKGLSVLIKGFGVLCLVAVLAFVFLFVTMEKEGTLQKEIGNKEAYIRSQREIASQLVRQKEEISQKAASMMKADLARKAKIEIMELNLEIHQLDERVNQLEADIAVQEKEIQKNRRKIEEMKRKSLLRRLLRQ